MEPGKKPDDGSASSASSGLGISGTNNKKAGARWRPWLLRLAVVLVLALLVWAWLRPDPVSTEIVAVTRGPMQVTVDNLGQLRAAERYTMTAPVAAVVQRIALREGDRVRRDQQVATLELLPMDERQRQEAQARLQAAQARAQEATVQIRRAQADVQLTGSELARAEQLVGSRFIAPQAADKARAAAAVATAELNAARSREQAALADVRLAQSALLSDGGAAFGPGRALR
ncbi:MAG: hypothetical protein Q7U14_18025, partial [Lacisediminimonas sp.]|nr:hypothetical protein [Lacisediminimonas sp.]